jgi:hypothetical protein
MSCHTLPFLGDLHVDTIITSNDGPRHQPDQSGNIQSSGMHKCYRCPKNNFSADRLIVLPPPALHTRGHLPVFFVPEAECTQTTVFLRHIPSQTNHSIFHSNRALYKDDQPVANPEFETTFIILPAYWDHGIVLSQAHRPKFVDPLKMPANLHDLLGGLATWIRTHPNHTVNVIGIEDRNPYARPEYWKLNDGREVQWEKVFRDRLEAEMGGWTKKVIRTRMDTVNILTFQEFLQSNNWETTGLSSILVNRWLELLSLRVRIDSARGKKKLPLAKQSGFWYTLGRNEKLRVAAVEARAALRAKTEYPDRDQDDDAEVKKEPSTDNADSDIKMQDADAEGEADTQSVPRTPRRSVRLSGRNIVFMGEKKRKRKRRRDPDSSDDDIDNSDSSLSSLSSDDE